MKAAMLIAFGVFISASALSALGYTSAFVEAEQAYQRHQLGATKGFDDEEIFAQNPTPKYLNSSTMQLATPGFDPLTDATSKLVYGMMDAILLRFKQQLFISSVSQWKNELLRSDIKYFFPNLSRLLSTVDSNNFLASYDLWKSAIDRDLQETPLGVLNYSIKYLDSFSDINPEERILLTELRNLLNDIYTFRNVSNLHEFILVSTTDVGNHSQFFTLIGIIAKNMLDDSGELDVIGLDQFTKDPRKLVFYLEKIKQDTDRVLINNDTFRVTAENFKYYMESCFTVNSFFEELETRSARTASQRTSQSDYIKLYLATCDKLLVQWSNLNTSTTHDWNSYYSLFTKYRFRLLDITQMVDEKNYKGLINTMITTSIIIAEDHGYIPVSYSRFLSLISTVALTREAEEINYREVMNSILEPVGSYSYKRKSDFTIALNTYPGLGGGAETLDSKLSNAQAVAGLACPVGLELNWGHSVLGVSGLFFSALDLGAVASYRFAQDTTDASNSPQIGWKQLVSPGFYLLMQMEEHPVTLGLGMQVTPELRKVTDAGIVQDKNALRLGAFVSMDIPLFTFYVKHKWVQTSGIKS